ncbi:MAG TPA: sensor histidine kinase [Clostridiales bacterium]|nr:sensor histidine kinase [Clostridiales bacterium]
MNEAMLDVRKLNEILQQTIEVIEKSKEEIFDIAENARNECKRIESELEELKRRVSNIIKEVDELERLEKTRRRRLALVSKAFERFKESDIKAAYEEAKEIQMLIKFKREEEKNLLAQRTDLEKRLKNAYIVVNKAENLVSRVSVAMDYLNGNLKDVFEHLEDIKQKQELGIKIIKAQEVERQRIAREIHDGCAQLMANSVLKAELCEKLIGTRSEEEIKYELQQLKDSLRYCLKDVRKIIYDLRPMSLDDLGLIPTIERYIRNFEEETQIHISFSCTEYPVTIDPSIQLAIFRIIQEGLNNIRKYSKASTVVLKLEIVKDFVHLLIIDDGVGFCVEEKLNQSKDEKNSGFGLYIMKERAQLLRGKFDIQSDLGIGTRIKVTIPLKAEVAEDEITEN